MNTRNSSIKTFLSSRGDFQGSGMRACWQNNAGHSHGKSLPSNAGLMVGKRVLQGEAWSDLSDSRGTHDLGDKFGDLGDK
ncbi:hypothetical protein AVEN_121384-1 [Araneus ventricosus]|uniref:Uncharacterized protein n=1 Tax=Araneus ventricosus TaxID=182803 RepID=A0A4Y2CPI6_ARAVE|nr:hypothetical protein AVEN_121384-1 [Araneus ventricosus]